MSMTTLVAENVSFGYQPAQPVVRDVSLRVERGDVLFLLGHNGSGKSSLLACLAGLERPQAGRVTLDGRDVHAMAPSERARHVGMIPQLHVAAFAFRVEDVVAMGRTPHLGTFASPGPEDRAIVLRALERVGMADAAGRPYTELSGGERQLVLVARGLAQRCDVLLMDEPDAHLDPRNRFRVLEAVHELSRDAGLSFVIASHDPGAALMFADRVELLRDGRSLAGGAVNETLTEEHLSAAYDLRTEVVTKVVDGRRVPRAIVPRRIDRVPDEMATLAVDLDDLDRPGSELARLLRRDRAGPVRLLVTGGRGAGKSRWCASLVDRLRSRGWRVAGVASPAVLSDGRKVAIDLVDVVSGARRRLADRRRDVDGGVTTERWRFETATLAWGNELLAGVAEAGTDLLLADELGPLELRRGGGLRNGLRAMDEGRFSVGCAVVRPALLDRALERWPGAWVVDVED